MNEPGFIAALRAIATHPAARGLADDAAVIEIGGETLVLSHDMLAEGVHVLEGTDPADIAWKLVATNMSDLAAKGAEPVGVLLGHVLGRDDARFVAGLTEALAHYRAPLLGGDTIAGVAGAPRVWGLTAIGRATHRPVPSRAGARVGEALYLTGPVGGAMLGLEALRAGGDPTGPHAQAYLRPVALLAQGRALAPQVGAMMDVSDGLLLDAARMADASGVTLAIERADVPIAPAESRRDDALRWGDDYQLLFTTAAPPPVAAHRIGAVLTGGAHPLLLDGTPPVGALGYHHS